VEAIAGLVVIPGVVGVAIGLPWAICLGYPIHVRDASTNWITLAGVSGKFVKAWKARPPSIESSSEVPCLDVFPYRPDGVCPWPATLFLFLAAVLGGLIAGLAIGGGGLQLATFTQGWDNNDVRYLGVLGILLFFQGVLFWVMLVSWRRLYVVVPILMLPAAVLLVLLAWGVSFLGIIKLSSATTTCLYFLPLILLMLLVYRQTVVQKIRSPLVAGIAGAVGLFLALLGLWLSTQGSDFFRRNRDMAIFYLGAPARHANRFARIATRGCCEERSAASVVRPIAAPKSCAEEKSSGSRVNQYGRARTPEMSSWPCTNARAVKIRGNVFCTRSLSPRPTTRRSEAVSATGVIRKPLGRFCKSCSRNCERTAEPKNHFQRNQKKKGIVQACATQVRADRTGDLSTVSVAPVPLCW
jgi:hypothetical protein